VTFLSRLFGNPARERAQLRPLYDAIVREARQPAWYVHGGVPDTVDGRFDMVSALLSLVLLRLEREGDATKRESVLLTEIFIDDMDGTLRQFGIGDIVVGKHIGKIMGALGGRLGAFRDAFAGTGDLDEAVRRNVFRDAAPSEGAVAFVAARLRGVEASLSALPLARLIAGEIAR
jgi:cytochrome b pre-mRNA-processing protein 3